MKSEELQNLIGIRQHMIEVFNALEAKNTPSGVIKQSEMAIELEQIIKKLDNVLSSHVNFS